MMAQVAFYILGTIAVISSLFMITRKNPVHAALWMLLTFFVVAGIFVQLDAEFIAAIQVLVYAGAILVLYMFVVMLLNPDTHGFVKIPLRYILGIAASIVVFLQVIMTINYTDKFRETALHGFDYASGFTNVKLFGKVLFTDYLVPFEIASLLLLVAMIGAIVIAKKD